MSAFASRQAMRNFRISASSAKFGMRKLSMDTLRSKPSARNVSVKFRSSRYDILVSSEPQSFRCAPLVAKRNGRGLREYCVQQHKIAKTVAKKQRSQKYGAVLACGCGMSADTAQSATPSLPVPAHRLRPRPLAGSLPLPAATVDC
eukprot:m.288529 g.288529  ORF g.288529 m.288529 type:complete len:146 (+) comp55045_c0_seq1:980-1417(+)